MEEMSKEKYLDIMKKIQENILLFLDNNSNSEENFRNLKKLFDDQRINNNSHLLKSLLHLIVKIGNNHYREPNFFSKIEQILSFFTDDIKKYFSNSEIFYIFNSNKRILLFLVEEKILSFDDFVAKTIIYNFSRSNYPEYFAPEIKPFTKAKWYPRKRRQDPDNIYFEAIKKELPENFYEFRKEGENEKTLYKLIRKDLVKEFITFVNKNSIPLNSTIENSIYETNHFLIKSQNESKEYLSRILFKSKKVNVDNNNVFTLIKYAVFYGSIQIFNYLRLNDVEITPSLWFYAIHGKNEEIIHFLEDMKIDKPFSELFTESIKCHHNDIANYFLNNYLLDVENSNLDINQCLKYYNFSFIQSESINETLFRILCKYDYYILVEILLKERSIDTNGELVKT